MTIKPSLLSLLAVVVTPSVLAEKIDEPADYLGPRIKPNPKAPRIDGKQDASE
ncbi:MAG: hypothetical protein ACQKBU_00080 [Verrucomicrobiales bacterium]